MANNLKGLTVEIGGNTSGLSDALKSVNGNISNLQANLRTVNSALKLDPSNVEAVAMKQELLTQAVEATREKLETLREAQRQADEQMANGTEIDQRAYQNLRAEIVRAESSLNDYERQLNDMSDAADDAADDLDDLSDSADDASDDLDDAGDEADEAAEKFEELADSASEGAERMQTGFSNIASGVGTVVTAVTGAFAAVGAAMLYASESTAEYRKNMTMLETAFTHAGHTAETASQTYKDFFGFLGDEGQATEASQHLAQLTSDQQALAEWTTIAAGVYSTFGASLPIEGLMEAANETARTGVLTGGLVDAINWGSAAGETFGVTLRENTEENKAWNEAVAAATTAEEFFALALQECTTQAEREALIRDTLNGIYSESGEAYRENAADLIASNDAQVRYTEAMAVFGEKSQPILTAVRNGFTSILEAATGLLDNVDMDAITAAIEGAFAWFIDTAVPAIKEAIQWVVDHKDIILGFITAVGVGFVAWNVTQTISGAVLAIKSLVDILKLASAGQLKLNAAMKANIIGIVITAVSMLVSAFIYLWNNCEGFRNFFINMWEAIKAAFAAVVEWFNEVLPLLGQFFIDAWEAIKNAWSAVGEFFSGIWSGIQTAFANVGNWFSEKFTQAKDLAQNAWSGVTNFFANAKSGITNAFSTVDSFMSSKFGGAWTAVKSAFSPFVGYFQQIWNTVKGIFSAVKQVLSGNFSGAWESIKGIFSGWGSFFSGLWDTMKNAFSNVAQLGKDIVRGLWNGINDMVGWITGKIKSFGENVLSGIKNFFGIKSPSTVMRDQVGRDLVRGVGVGIEENADEAIEPMDDLVSEMTGVNIDRNISNTFSGTAVNEFGGLSERLDAVVGYLSKYLPGLADNASQSIYLDGNTLVGALGGRIDAELARQYMKKGRGQ